MLKDGLGRIAADSFWPHSGPQNRCGVVLQANPGSTFVPRFSTRDHHVRTNYSFSRCSHSCLLATTYAHKGGQPCISLSHRYRLVLQLARVHHQLKEDFAHWINRFLSDDTSTGLLYSSADTSGVLAITAKSVDRAEPIACHEKSQTNTSLAYAHAQQKSVRCLAQYKAKCRTQADQ